VSGDLADEITTTDTFDGRLTVNARRTAEINTEMEAEYRRMHQAHLGATTAAKLIGAAAPNAKWQRGEMYVVKGFTEIFFAEGWCSGTPFSTESEYGKPNTTKELFQMAVASFDSAIQLADTSKRVCRRRDHRRQRAEDLPVRRHSLHGQRSREQRHVRRGRQRREPVFSDLE
jgi:hypothetical protein